MLRGSKKASFAEGNIYFMKHIFQAMKRCFNMQFFLLKNGRSGMETFIRIQKVQVFPRYKNRFRLNSFC